MRKTIKANAEWMLGYFLLALAHGKSFVKSPLRLLKTYTNSHYRIADARWKSSGSLMPEWNERTKLMASMVAPNSSVLEFGSGDERLKEWLPEGCTYQPSDMLARSEQTLVCDLNQDFPNLEGRHFDVIVFSGVLEYIHDIPRLLKGLTPDF
jgi:phospholipid N-methyltransferase